MITATCLIIYALGFFLAMGLFTGISIAKDDFDFGTVILAIIFGILSWFSIGFIFALMMDNISTKQTQSNVKEKSGNKG